MLLPLLRPAGEAMDRWLDRRVAWLLVVATSWFFAAVALAFGSLAVYSALRDGFGTPEAATILGIAFGIAAAAVAALAVSCRGRLREGTPASPGKPIQTDGIAAVIDTLTGHGTSSAAPALAGLAQLSKTLSPIQLAVLALVGGFVAGRKLPAG